MDEAEKMTGPFAKGDLLIAAVALADPNFHQTIVLLCEHEEEHGSYGLILNRAIETPDEVLSEVPFVDGRLFQGGPVHSDVIQVLHPYGETLEGSQLVLPGVWFGANFEALQSGIMSGVYAPAACRFFLGYSGWGEGQLADEFDADAWLVAPGNHALVFETGPEQLWAATIRARGTVDPVYAHYPENPMWN